MFRISIKNVVLTIVTSIGLGFAMHIEPVRADMMTEGVRVDPSDSETIVFTIPVAGAAGSDVGHTWIRVVTDPNITPVTFNIGLQNESPELLNAPPQVKTVEDSANLPIADAIYQFGPTGHPNVYEIHINHENHRPPVTPGNAETWELEINNDDAASVGVFAVYIGDSEPEIEGVNVWIRDNATVDPSGHHTLHNDPDNLDITNTPTPGEYWKSPTIRFTSANGTPTKNPVGNETNNVFVKVRNFGTTPLASVDIEAYWTEFSAGLPSFPDPQWNPLGVQTVASIDPGESRETPSFQWPVPPAPGPGQPNHFCLFVRTIDSSGALDPIDYSFTNVNDLTRLNTNASHRNVVIIPVVDPPPNGPFPFFIIDPTGFFLNNPFATPQLVDLRIIGLPDFARATQLKLTVKPEDKLRLEGIQVSDGQGVTHGTAIFETVRPIAFEIVDPKQPVLGGIHLQPGETRPVALKFAFAEPTKNFQPAVIDVETVSGNKVLGGVTYVLENKDLEPSEEEPAKPEAVKGEQIPIFLLIMILIVVCLIIGLLMKKPRT